MTTFSGGMRQRFGVAQALIGDPRLLIVDEPTAGLDPGERNRFYNLLAEVGEQVIVILSTHIVEDVTDLCTRMAILNQGRVRRPSGRSIARSTCISARFARSNVFDATEPASAESRAALNSIPSRSSRSIACSTSCWLSLWSKHTAAVSNTLSEPSCTVRS